MTVEWFQFQKKLLEDIKNNWVDSLYVGASADETIQRNAAALGQADLLKRLLEAEFLEIYDSE